MLDTVFFGKGDRVEVVQTKEDQGLRKRFDGGLVPRRSVQSD